MAYPLIIFAKKLHHRCLRGPYRHLCSGMVYLVEHIERSTEHINPVRLYLPLNHPKVFYKKDVLKNCAKCTGKQTLVSEAPF